MVDPVTAIGLATSAFNGIKTMIATGKDFQDMVGQLGQWGKAISDLDYAQKKADKPKWWKALGGGIQANAVEVWAHKKKADAMRDELKDYVSLYYGPSAWQEILRLEAEMRKEQQEAVYAAEEMKEKIVNWMFGIFVTSIAILIMGGIIYWIGITQGRW